MEATHLYKWYILRTVLSYWNITKRCLMYLHEKSEILYNPNTDELLNKPFELIAKCHHGNKYLLCNYSLKLKNITKNRCELPRDVLEDWLSWKLRQVYEEITTLRGVQAFPSSSLIVHFPWKQFLQISGQCIWKSVVTPVCGEFPHQGIVWRSLPFAERHGALYLSSNFTRIKLHDRCFPICLYV